MKSRFRKLEPMRYACEAEVVARQREADRKFQRLLANAYVRGEFPSSAYPNGRPPLILTGG